MGIISMREKESRFERRVMRVGLSYMSDGIMRSEKEFLNDRRENLHNMR